MFDANETVSDLRKYSDTLNWPSTGSHQDMSYACFISYRRPETNLEKRIIGELHRYVHEHLSIRYGTDSVFIDDRRLRYGDLVEDTLAQALHKSACMIMIYKPEYFDCEHTFCAREYKAMQKIETERLSKNVSIGQSGLIIPIIITCGSGMAIPQEITQRLYLTIDTLKLQEESVRRTSCYRTELKKVLEYIIDRYEAARPYLDSQPTGQANPSLPSHSELTGWLCDLAPKSKHLPFRNESGC